MPKLISPELIHDAEEKEIDGFVFRCTQFNGQETFKNWITLTKLIGVPFAELLQSVLKGNSLKDILDKKLDSIDFDISTAVAMLLRNLDENVTLDFVKKLLAKTVVNDTELVPNFNTVFSAKLTLLFKVIYYVLESNYGDFFAIASNAAEASKTTKTAEVQKQEQE